MSEALGEAMAYEVQSSVSEGGAAGVCLFGWHSPPNPRHRILSTQPPLIYKILGLPSTLELIIYLLRNKIITQNRVQKGANVAWKCDGEGEAKWRATGTDFSLQVKHSHRVSSLLPILSQCP